jgi:hypothetical protein
MPDQLQLSPSSKIKVILVLCQPFFYKVYINLVSGIPKVKIQIEMGAYLMTSGQNFPSKPQGADG